MNHEPQSTISAGPAASDDPPAGDSAAGRRTSAILASVAALALAGNCLLISPSRFSDKHEADRSPLKPVVTAMALGGAFPTSRGVEIRNLVFYGGAVVLALVAGVRLVSGGRRPRLCGDDILDFRRQAAGPCFWWCLLLLASVLSSTFSHAPGITQGPTLMHFLFLAWWWPLAALLAPRHVGKLAAALLGILALTAAVGVWYYRMRNAPGTRLLFPLGNPTWFAACLLPGVFIAAGLATRRLVFLRRNAITAGSHSPDSGRVRSFLQIIAALLAVGVILVALYLTRSRAAAGAGLAVGVFALAFFMTRSAARRIVALAAVLAMISGVVYVQKLRATGVMGERAHSIRTRLDYQWPYALTLFLKKPVLGHGDGAYSLLAGQFAREDQLDDPGTISFDERSWIAHPHNEFLELLADLGIVGAVAFAAALGVTLFRAVRYCDDLRDDRASRSRRWLAAGLAAALVALVIEECAGVALRHPGLPPIFLTVWALLWALVRDGRKPPAPAPEDQRLRLSTVRLGGLAVCIAAAVLGLFAVQDWRAARALHEADTALADGRFEDTVRHADFAGGNLLDPLQKLSARVFSVWGRSLMFDRNLNASEAPPSDEDLKPAQQALMRLERLKYDAPRFLRLARFEAEVSLNLARAFDRRGEKTSAQQFHERFVAAAERHRADEPFRFDSVVRLWAARPTAPARDRLTWLRALLRAGEIDDGFLQLFRQMDAMRDFVPAMNDLFNIATADQSRLPAQWQDPLAPETFRVAALARALTHQYADAVKYAARAVTLYEKAGPALYAAHAAALHERVRYDFAQDPAAHTEDNLRRLAQAQAISVGPADARSPLPASLGKTRLRLLLAAGREDDARRQAAFLEPDDSRPLSRHLANAYLDVAGRFAGSRHTSVALSCARRAVELAPESADAWGLLTRLLVHRGDDAEALEAALRLIELVERQDALSYLSELQQRYPGSRVWQRLSRLDLGLPPATAPAEDADTAEAASPQR